MEKKLISFDEKGRFALDQMESTTKNIFLTGKAGTGKSTLLKFFLETTKKNVAVLAPTGVAALNIGGATIHSFFNFPTNITTSLAEKKGKQQRKNELYTHLEAIIIDEISMVRCDIFDCINVFLQTARGSTLPFGDIQMICIGDLHQLPPVVTHTEKLYFNSIYRSPYFFSANVFSDPNRQISIIELEKIYRQEEEDFIGLLNHIRHKTVSDEHLRILNNRVIEENFVEIEEGTMYLATKNSIAEEINTFQLLSLKNKSMISHAKITGDISEKHFPTQSTLTLKIGAQVMFVANDSSGQRVNGTLGKVTGFDEKFVTVKIFGGEEVEVTRHIWKVNQYTFDKKSGKLGSEAIGSFTQIPLTLARAITIHKSQGKTFDKAIIDFTGGTFAHGQAYVALSRCRSLKGLSLVLPIKSGDIIMDSMVTEFLTSYKYSEIEENTHIDNIKQLIKSAIKQQKKLRFCYRENTHGIIDKLITPEKIGEMKFIDKSFLGVRGFCHINNETGIYNLEKISNISIE